MKKHLRFVPPGLLLAAALFLVSCGGSGAAQQGGSGSAAEAQPTTEGTGSMAGMNTGSGGTAPAMLAPSDGNYSDERFIDMMVPHHQTAVDMAKVAQQKGEHPETTQLADNIISDQQKEIKELKDIRERDYGSSETPSQMNPTEMDNVGMMMPDQLAEQQPFDRAFIDSMMPHHSSAIEMASVALIRSDDPDIERIARGIIDGQAKEVGRMIQWRQEWYPES